MDYVQAISLSQKWPSEAPGSYMKNTKSLLEFRIIFLNNAEQFKLLGIDDGTTETNSASPLESNRLGVVLFPAFSCYEVVRWAN